ncbi:MAG: RagB/SusD family nutrient uptake outer membrane protein [Paludibacteraceae bacterium]|nr:RagB/SusD family nutrient uptake outer membrane protein [Paludibacteraceae bacterium]
MKKNIKTVVAAVIVMFGFAACMDLEPIDPNTIQINSENEQQVIDALYAKLYCAFVQTGQTGGGGNADIITDDEGYSGYYRTLCVLNEFPTDAGWWTWRNDAGCSDLLMLCWTASNPFVSKLYNRLNYAVTMSNHYLDLTEGRTDEETKHRRAEVRFIRAVNYYALLDMFGNVPFTVTMTGEDPHQIARADLYEWLVDEIINGHNGKTYNVSTYKVTGDADHGFLNDMFDKGATTIYRATKPAAYMLLARLYLNAEVYTGTAQWAKAEEAARKVIESYPTLHKPFAQIFMGDNDQAAAEEMVFLAACDGANIRSYAGSQYTIASCRNQKMNDCGQSDNNWGCWRSSPELIKVFFPGKTPAEIVALGKDADEFAMPAIAKDDRAMFCAKNQFKDALSGQIEDNVKGFLGYVPNNGDGFDSCWAICKWTNKYSSQFDANLQPIADAPALQHDSKYSDTDVPIMRASEAYLTLAEALLRQGKAGEALAEVNKVRQRANAADLASLTEDEMLDEWLREFYHEGRRRIDLIRFGQFTGSTCTRTWEGRSGNNQVKVTSFDNPNAWNTNVVNIDTHYNLYPIPETDVVANPNVKQNPGY